MARAARVLCGQNHNGITAGECCSDLALLGSTNGGQKDGHQQLVEAIQRHKRAVQVAVSYMIFWDLSLPPILLALAG